MKASFKIPRPPAAVRARLKKIRLFAMDVDGVLTAGDIVVLNSGEEIKIWNVKERIGLFALKKFSPRFKIAWITGRSSPQVAARAREIGVDHYLGKPYDEDELLKLIAGCVAREP